jgi:predicted nucleic acid-binding protein
MQKYRDVPISFADACLVYMAGEIGTGEVLTLDPDFHIYRWSANKRFRQLVPLF